MPVNSRGTVRLSHAPGIRTLREARIADMAALEALPRSIRFLLGELALNMCCHSVLAFYRSIEQQARNLGGSAYDAEVHTLRKLAELEAGDQDAFAALYERSQRLKLPHAAAEASILRYGPLTGRVRASLARHGARRIPLPAEIQEAA